TSEMATARRCVRPTSCTALSVPLRHDRAGCLEGARPAGGHRPGHRTAFSRERSRKVAMARRGKAFSGVVRSLRCWRREEDTMSEELLTDPPVRIVVEEAPALQPVKLPPPRPMPKQAPKKKPKVTAKKRR